MPVQPTNSPFPYPSCKKQEVKNKTQVYLSTILSIFNASVHFLYFLCSSFISFPIPPTKRPPSSSIHHHPQTTLLANPTPESNKSTHFANLTKPDLNSINSLSTSFLFSYHHSPTPNYHFIIQLPTKAWKIHMWNLTKASNPSNHQPYN